LNIDAEPAALPADTDAPAPSRRRLFGAGLLLAVLLFAIIFAASRWLGRGAAPASAIAFAPAQADEFLIVVAPFRRGGGDPQPIGGTLANDLRLAPAAEHYRVELLPRAPDPAEIADLLAFYAPHLLVSGQYDAVDITLDVRLIPSAPPPLPAAGLGSAALSPAPTPRTYQLYAPAALERPLRYLDAWIIGQSYFWRGAYDEALPLLTEAQRLLPRQAPIDRRQAMDRFAADLNWQLGYIAGPAQGNWQAARDLFRAALRLAPHDPAPALGLAAALAQLNDIPQAAEILRQTLRSRPDAWQVHFALAEIAAQQGDSGIALTNYEQAITLLAVTPGAEHSLADIYLSRGYYWLDLDDPQKAQADLQQAVDLGREDVTLYASLGWLVYEAGDFESAVRHSAAARQLAPDRPDLAFNEALHLLAAGQIDAARIAYAEAIDLTLTFADVITRSTYFGGAYYDLADLAARQPEKAEIIAELQERIDLANG